MSDQEEDRDMPDANGDAADVKPETVQYGELSISSAQDTIAAGVAAGNIHLQATDAATLALPEVRTSSCKEYSMNSAVHRHDHGYRQAKKQGSNRNACCKLLRKGELCGKPMCRQVMQMFEQLCVPSVNLSPFLVNSRYSLSHQCSAMDAIYQINRQFLIT